jgi:hypothetical protein
LYRYIPVAMSRLGVVAKVMAAMDTPEQAGDTLAAMNRTSAARLIGVMDVGGAVHVVPA